MVKDSASLRNELRRIDGAGYKAYKGIRGEYRFPSYTLTIDHIQGDPFASPSRIRVLFPIKNALFPEEFLDNNLKQIALSDFIGRKFKKGIYQFGRGIRGTGRGGLIWIEAGGQKILARSSVVIVGGNIEVRFRVGLPARGRRILGQEAISIFFTELPKIISFALIYDKREYNSIKNFVELFVDVAFLRDMLSEKGLVSFIGNDSLLPRKSGISDLPLSRDEAVLFKSPESLKVEFSLPSGKRICGMGIPKGVTLIVGGGFHGKSTLLRAIELGIYTHIPGDGREYVVTDPRAVKIRAEDGRNIEKVDISSFINNLPMGRPTIDFTTTFASGSTSQAANIVEAMEIGTRVLLIDEDTSATNFMIRDFRMQKLVEKEKEPITPFLDRVRGLYERYGISTVLVLGGSGDYFDKADTVIMMDEYLPRDVTDKAKNIVNLYPLNRDIEPINALKNPMSRIPLSSGFNFLKGRKIKIDNKGEDIIVIGQETIELDKVEQIVDHTQTKAIAYIIYYLVKSGIINNYRTMKEVMDIVDITLEKDGIDVFSPFSYPIGDMSSVRKYEVAAAINRLRTLKIKQKEVI